MGRLRHRHVPLRSGSDSRDLADNRQANAAVERDNALFLFADHSKHANYNVQAQTRISGQESPDGPARNYYTEMKRKYLATGDKRVLVREYCLDDPGLPGADQPRAQAS